LSEYVITEAGFGADLGAEKFLDIKCVSAGLQPNAVVIVATVRALKYHGGAKLDALTEENLEALEKGLVNLEKHVENIGQFNIPAVVAINQFLSDTDAEMEMIKQRCEKIGVKAVIANVWGKGGVGAEELAREVVNVADDFDEKFTPMYDWNDPVVDKIEAVAKKIYGAKNVEFSSKAKLHLRKISRLGLDHLPVCIAKTQKSLSDDPKLIGRPRDFTITVREIEIAAGAKFLVPITGNMMRMPGLPAKPAAELIDIDNEGNITGLF